MFQAVYNSPLHVPVMAWIGCVVSLAIALAKNRLLGFAIFFSVVCALDAWLTGPWTPLRGALATAASVTFVIAGDFRYFVLVARGIETKTTVRGLAAALAVAFSIPVITQIARAAGLPDDRPTWLFYEGTFVGFAIGGRILLRRVLRESGWRDFVLRLTMFELVQYGLWALADVILIATKADAGYLVRLVPNLMYYAFFLPFAIAAAPEEGT
jgi:hypothetical protein